MVAAPTPPYRIRRMEPRDIPQVAGLERAVFKDPWPDIAFIQELYFNTAARYFVLQIDERFRRRQQHRPWHARSHNEVHGYVGMRVNSGEGHISTLALHASYRGLGLGEILLITALEQAGEMGAYKVALEVRVLNERAQNLYTKYKFAVISTLRHYYRDGADAYLMEVEPLDAPYLNLLRARRAELEARIARSFAQPGRHRSEE
ncbi:MAG: GNAT family N-acetyltransferase [Anaerolineales bacterium]